ncbi:MAG: YdeI/OmpD-associated family protein [Deltaproteobacteria bacterium]|nr:YdeI/OmpD-associated family protein [Nannocystaceae bacterium]
MVRQEPEVEHIYAKDRQTWRRWLGKHHRRGESVWLVYYKKDSGTPSITYAEAVEEALCYGWIDSRPNKLDAERYKQLFSPRKPKSPWSTINKKRALRLIKAGQMTPAGLAKIEAAKQDGSWSSYDGVDSLVVPKDLAAGLAANKTAKRYFAEFPPSSQKIILWWIASAKRPATRAARIAETIRLAAENIRANHWRQNGTRSSSDRKLDRQS